MMIIGKGRSHSSLCVQRMISVNGKKQTPNRIKKANKIRIIIAQQSVCIQLQATGTNSKQNTNAINNMVMIIFILLFVMSNYPFGNFISIKLYHMLT